MRVTANLSWLFTEAGSTVAARCGAARAAGFKLVESDWPGAVTPDQYKTALTDTGLTPVLVNCYQGDTAAGECGFAAEPGKEAQFKDSLQRTLDMATTIGCTRIHILSGRSFGPDQSAAQEATFVANLRYAVPLLQQQGVTALIEPINPVSKPGYFLSDFPTGVRVVEAVASDCVRLQLDVFHLQMISGDAASNIKKLLPLAGHVQVAQATSRHEPSYEGQIDYNKVFATLKEEGYSGFIGCEYKPSGRTEDCLSWVTHQGLQF